METRVNYRTLVSRLLSTESKGGEAFEKFESAWQRKSRHYSLIIIYFAFFVLRMQESIYYISIWNYLLYIDPDTETTFLGMIYLVSSLASLVASLVLGKLTNVISSTKLPIISGVALMTMGNFLMAFAHAFPGDRKWAVLVAKTMVNIGMGVQGNMTAYLAMGSKLKERNKIMSFRSAMISFASVVGGCIQMAFSTVGYPGYVIGPFRFDMYTLPAYTCAFMELILLLMITIFFNESWVSVYENSMKKSSARTKLKEDDVVAGTSLEEKEHLLMDSNSKLYGLVNSPNQIKLKPMDRIAAFVIVADRFVYSFCGYGFRTIAPPLTMLMFGWSPREVIFYNSLAMILCYTGRAITELSIPFILRFASERLLMVVSCFLLIIFYLVSFAWPTLPSLFPPANHSQFGSDFNSTNPLISEQPCGGIYGNENDFMHCANSTHAKNYYLNNAVLSSSMYDNCTQNWCNDITKINIYQFCIGYFVLQVAAMPTGILAASTLLTKIPGPRKQGTVQGVYAAVGQLSASIAPPLATVAYQYAGPRPVWGMGFGILTLAIILTICFYGRLLPWQNYKGASAGVAHSE